MASSNHSASCRREFCSHWKLTGLPMTSAAQRQVFKKNWKTQFRCTIGHFSGEGLPGCCQWNKRSRLVAEYLKTEPPSSYSFRCVACRDDRCAKASRLTWGRNAFERVWGVHPTLGFCGRCSANALRSAHRRFVHHKMEDESVYDLYSFTPFNKMSESNAHIAALCLVAALASVIEAAAKQKASQLLRQPIPN